MGLRCRSRGVYGGSYPVSTWRAIWKLFRLCETQRDPPSSRGVWGQCPQLPSLCGSIRATISLWQGVWGQCPQLLIFVRLNPCDYLPLAGGLGAVPPVTIFVRLNPCDYLPLAGGSGGSAPSYHLCAAQSVRLSPSSRGPGGCAPSYQGAGGWESKTSALSGLRQSKGHHEV